MFQQLTTKCLAYRRGQQQALGLQSVLPVSDTEDAKSERIRQLHHTMSTLIDERDDLLDQVDSLSQSGLAAELEDAHSEIEWLRVQVESGTTDQ